MADPMQSGSLAPIPRRATIRITPADNGGYVVFVEIHASIAGPIYAAFSNGSDLLAGLAMIYTPLPPAREGA